MSRNQIRMLLVNEQVSFADILSHFLDARFRVIGQAPAGSETLRATAHLQPDLVLMDVTTLLPHCLETTRQLKKTIPNAPPVILLTLQDNPETEAAARAAGADRLVFKYHMDRELRPVLTHLFPS
jgi:DNA-binding NarL/FixJ family response regulator